MSKSLKEIVEKRDAGETVKQCPNCGTPLEVKKTQYSNFLMCPADTKECKIILFGLKSDIAHKTVKANALEPNR